MKPIFRLMILIVTTLLFVSFIGCGADDEDDVDKDDVDDVVLDFDFVGNTWQVVSINGLMFEELFTPAEPEPGEPEFEYEFMLGGNSWVFNSDGSFTGSLEFIATEKYPEPVSSMTQEITIASEGVYTAEDTTLTITKHDLKADVVVKLEPKEVWEQQIQGKTVEALENDLAEETKKGFSPTVSGALFKEGTEYTWSLQENTLTVTSVNQKIALERKSE